MKCTANLNHVNLSQIYILVDVLGSRFDCLPPSEELDYNYEDGDFSDAEDDFSEVEGIASVSFDSLAQNGLKTTKEDSDGSDMPDKMEGGSRAPYAGNPGRWSGRSSQTGDLDVVCSDHGFEVTFLTSPLSDVSVLGMYLAPILPSKYHFVKCILRLDLAFLSRNQ